MSTKIYVNTATYDVGFADPEDSWDRPDTNTEYMGLALDRGWNYIEVDFTGTAYVVLCDYNSGDTFGADHGIITPMAVFDTREKAQKFMVEALKSEEDKGQEIRQDYSFEFDGKNYWRTWIGYFESLNSLFIDTIEVPQNEMIGD